MGLPLLRLPHLVITNLVDITRIEDLTCLSLCSKRTRNILIVCRRQNRFKGQHISANADSYCTAVNLPYCRIEMIQLSNLESYMNIGLSKKCELFSNRTVASVTDEIRKLGTVEIYGQRVPCFRYSEVLLTFWDDETIGLRKCMDFARETFGMPFVHLEVAQNGIWAFDWVNRCSNLILITVETFGMQDSQLEHILRNNWSLILEIKNKSMSTNNACFPSKSFRFPDMWSVRSDHFIASPCHWFTVDDLIISDFVTVDIEKTRMTNGDLNRFLSYWIEGVFEKRLKTVFIQLCETISITKVTAGMENDFRKTSSQHEFSREGCERFPYHQFDIQQRGGGTETASIRFHSIQNSMLLSVWD